MKRVGGRESMAYLRKGRKKVEQLEQRGKETQDEAGDLFREVTQDFVGYGKGPRVLFRVQWEAIRLKQDSYVICLES